MKIPVTVILAVAIAACSSGAAAQYVWQAREAARIAPGAIVAPAPVVQGSGSGLQIFVDPATGQIRPPEQEDLRALAREPVAPQFTPVPQLFFGKDGVPGVRLDPSFDSYMVAIRHADGTLAMECLPGKAQASDAVTRSAAPTGSVPTKPALDEK